MLARVGDEHGALEVDPEVGRGLGAEVGPAREPHPLARGRGPGGQRQREGRGVDGVAATGAQLEQVGHAGVGGHRHPGRPALQGGHPLAQLLDDRAAGVEGGGGGHRAMIEHLFERVKTGAATSAGRVASVSHVVSTLTEVAVDCADPHALARFWCAALGYEVLEVEGDDLVSIGPAPTAGGRVHPGPPTLGFARVPEPKAVKNRLHLDVNPRDRDQDAEVRRLLDLGARRADAGADEHSWVVLLDPEGNEFCVLATRVA